MYNKVKDKSKNNCKNNVNNNIIINLDKINDNNNSSNNSDIIGNINNNISNNNIIAIKCKYCNNKDNNKMVKCGFNSSGKQRYRCKECNKTFSIGEDNRIKHSIAERRMCITLYLNSMSMRKIQRVLNMEFHKKVYIYNIVHWIRNADKILKEEIKNIKEEYYKENINNNNKKLIVMEMDENKPRVLKKSSLLDFGNP